VLITFEDCMEVLWADKDGWYDVNHIAELRTASTVQRFGSLGSLKVDRVVAEIIELLLASQGLDSLLRLAAYAVSEWMYAHIRDKLNSIVAEKYHALRKRARRILL
jgi:hypothetical protein